MKIERYDMIVIGAGPAGLSAAIEAAKKELNQLYLMKMKNRVDSYLSRFTNFLVQRSIRQK